MRPIKFRAKMLEPGVHEGFFVYANIEEILSWNSKNGRYYGEVDWETFGEFTGLLDKNGLTEIYEGDIIGVDGIKKGNIHENQILLQEKTNLVIPSITSKDWQATYVEAMGRGCRHSE